MNIFKISIYGLFFILALFQSTIIYGQTKADDYMAISETLSYYLDGGTYNDFPKLAKAFHKDATMKSIGEEYKSVNALDFFEKRIKPGPPSNRQTKIVSINYCGHAANAVLHIDYPDFRFVDFMNLLKIEGTWKIVNKLFYTQKSEINNTIEPDLSVEEQEVLSVLHRWKMAYINQNATPLESILADSWTYSGGADGKYGNKKATIEGIKKSNSTLLAVNFSNLKTEKVGDAVIVRGKEELISEENGQTNSHHLMFTDVFKKIDGHWQAISTHSSGIDND